MMNDKGIYIKNIYYMLAYAFQVLCQKNYREIASEEFQDVQDLFAAILARGIAQQLKQGLYRTYRTKREEFSVLRGKLCINGTIHNQMQRKKVLSCEYDELSVNNLFNQILKTTAWILIREPAVLPKYRADLKKVMVFFDEVEEADAMRIRWDMLRYQRNNRNYEMLMNICYFVLNGMLQTTENGSYKMTAFSDEHMYKLYERFVLAYYKKHHTYLNEVKAARVKWNLSTETAESMVCFLPVMQTDVFLRYQEKVLIIDTKYYGKTMQSKFNKLSFHSQNMYQIFSYVKNQDAAGTGNVAGVLLYAKTQEAVTPDSSFVIGGNPISVKTLDLNQEFSFIAAQLDKIAEDYFGVQQSAIQNFL